MCSQGRNSSWRGGSVQYYVQFVSNGNFLARGGRAVSPLCTGERSYCAEMEEVGCREEGNHAIETGRGGAGTILAVAEAQGLNPRSRMVSSTTITYGAHRSSSPSACIESKAVMQSRVS